jgi:glutamyl aminopeptidase
VLLTLSLQSYSRETSLLYKNGETSSSAQQWVAVVIAHELAHQWFGNLVTMKWWNDLWLNEGFASWMEYKVGRGIKKKWEGESSFLEKIL